MNGGFCFQYFNLSVSPYSPFSGAALLRNWYCSQASSALSLPPSLIGAQWTEECSSLKQKCWLRLASGCQGNKEEDRGFGQEAVEFFWQVSEISLGLEHHYWGLLASWRASHSPSWPKVLGGTLLAVSSSGLGGRFWGLCFVIRRIANLERLKSVI